jgi:hypothetical protein
MICHYAVLRVETMLQSYLRPDESVDPVVDALEADPAVAGVFVLATDADSAHASALAARLGDSSLVAFGGAFPQIIAEGTRHETGTLLLGLREAPDVTVIEGLSDPGVDLDVQLPDLLGTGYRTAFVLADAFATRTEALVQSLFAAYGVEVTILGGGAGSLSMEQGPCLLTDDGWVADAAVLAATRATGSLGVSHGWQEFAGPFRVTDADGPVVRLIGDRPAFEVYRDVLEDDIEGELTAENFFEVAKSYPFGLSRFEAEKIVRDPFEPTDDGGIRCFGDVPAGSFVHVLRGDPDALIIAAGQAADAARTDAPSDGTTLFFDCISRVLYLGDEFDREIAAVAPENDPPLVGALTIGEIANSGREFLELYNKTAVVGVVGGL